MKTPFFTLVYRAVPLLSDVQMCGEMRFQLNQAKLRKDEAEKELKEYRMKAMRQMDVKEQVCTFSL